MQVVVPSTPANYFHVLRRQIRRDFRKPLICISPKSLLRLPACASDVEAFTETGFKTLIGETDSDLVPDEEVRRIIFCCGRVYYDLAKARSDKKIRDVVLIRIEQISPFPYDQVRAAPKPTQFLYASSLNRKPYTLHPEPTQFLYASSL